ncbi:MAG: glycosyltransferase [Lachnospiraceae bacterium]
MKITPHNITKGLRYLKHYGYKEFLIKLQERMEPDEVPYGPWREANIPTEEELKRQKKEQKTWKNRPLISIAVPTFHTPELFLRQMIASVEHQTYENWQLCIADGSQDNSVKNIVSEYITSGLPIKYTHLTENKGIAENTNAALALAGGSWIGLLDHDDLLAENALYEVVKAINANDTIDVVYTDEDKVNMELTEYFQPHLKPDYNEDLLRSNNYITHFFLVKKETMEQAGGGFQGEFDGAQDYDFIFRCTEKARMIYHVPEILYHWRVHQASTSDNPMSKEYAYAAGQHAIEGHLARMGQDGTVTLRKDLGFYDVKYPVKGKPLVSIIIPNKDERKSLETCLHSLEQSTYKNFEVIIVENNSQQPETFQYYETICQESYQPQHCQKSTKTPSCQGTLPGGQTIGVVTWMGEFNYSAINNFGFEFTQGEAVILLNNDIEMINVSWIEEMLGNCQRPEVGIVGGRLYYADDTIQHAGIVLGLGEGLLAGGIAGAVFVGMKRSYSGYLHKASIQLNYSAVTAACMMVKRTVYEAAGGMDEKLTVAFNDVDFCLKVVKLGYLVVYNPKVEAYHYESKSRGKEDTKEKVARFQTEIEYMRQKWITILKNGDPYYNKNLSLSKVNYALRVRR